MAIPSIQSCIFMWLKTATNITIMVVPSSTAGLHPLRSSLLLFRALAVHTEYFASHTIPQIQTRLWSHHFLSSSHLKLLLIVEPQIGPKLSAEAVCFGAPSLNTSSQCYEVISRCVPRYRPCCKPVQPHFESPFLFHVRVDNYPVDDVFFVCRCVSSNRGCPPDFELGLVFVFLILNHLLSYQLHSQ